MNANSLSKRYRIELSSIKDLLFYFLFLWSLALMFFAWFTFFFQNLEVPEALTSSYFILLSVYITLKEISRWTRVPMKIRRGEFFVFFWWLSLLVMIFVGFFFRLTVKEATLEIAYNILIAFLLGEVSKSMNAAYVKDNTSSSRKRALKQ